MKLTSLTAVVALILSNAVFAANNTWVGELYNIMPNQPTISEAYCKSHSLDTYKTIQQDGSPEVIANNGVKAKDIGSIKTEKVGGLYFHKAIVLFSGVENGKPWQEKAYFFYYGLNNHESPLQGIWYTKNCKGFYKSGAA